MQNTTSKDSNEIYRLYPEVKALLKARGITLKRIAAEKNISYTILSKTLSETTYKNQKGAEIKYQVPHIHRAIAEYLNIPNEELWSPEGKEILARMITEEAVKALSIKKESASLRRRWSLRWFFRNLIKLGMKPTNDEEDEKN